MKQEHYPSLELCKKLTEIKFPKTELGIFDTRKSWKKGNCPYVNEYEEPKFVPFWNIEIGDGDLEIDSSGNNPSAGYNNSLPLVYPSVMEMLDVMPDTIAQEYQLYLWKNNDTQYGVQYQDVYGNGIGECGKWFGTSPNALASMILWLHDNKYLSFN